MRILIAGAGFIGGRVAAGLLRAGHEAIPCGRNQTALQRRFPSAQAICCEFAEDRAEDWQKRLANIDAVINAAGIFQPRRANAFETVHVSGPRVLFEACAAARIPKVIQISALGTGASAQTRFHATKQRADESFLALARERNLRGWTVVRPSLVIGRGGNSTALFAALAALPWPPRLGDESWRVQPIHISDLVEALRLLLEREGVAPQVLDLVGPAPMPIDDLIGLLRQWLALPPARRLPLPEWLLRASIPAARLLSFNALSNDSLTMLKQGNTASVAPLTAALGLTPRPIEAALSAEPAAEADLWHARLYFLRPALRIGLAFIWIATAIISAFVYPLEKSVSMVAGLGVTSWQAIALVYAGAGVDGILGFGLLFNIRPAFIGLVQIATIAIFTILASFAIPQAWFDPLGPLTKNAAVLLATLVMIAMEARR
jgi:nucleoside-diphosphate-sugar epimerase